MGMQRLSGSGLTEGTKGAGMGWRRGGAGTHGEGHRAQAVLRPSGPRLMWIFILRASGSLERLKGGAVGGC